MSADITRFAESRIVAATVFSDAAFVTRRARVAGGVGLQRIVLEGLPSGLDPGTLRASTSLGLVRSIESDVIAKKTDGASETTTLETIIETLEGKSRRIQGEIAALELEIALIDKVVPARGSAMHANAAPPLRPDVFIAGLDVLTGRRRDAVHALRAAQDELRINDEELAGVRERLARIGDTNEAGDKRSVLVIALDSQAAGECIVDVTYRAEWATWRPYYHIRLQPKDNTIECVRFADVWQETREDWSDVKLRLSTAEPETGLRLPSVLPWTLGMAKSFEDKISDLYARRKKRAPAPSPAKPVAPAAPPPPPGGPLGGDDFTRYQQQFEEEGEFADITASGVATMRPVPKDGAAHRISDRAPTQDLDEGAVADASSITPFTPPMIQSQRRIAGADHPDFAMLSATIAPKDAAGGIDHEFEVGGATSCRSGKERNRLSFGSVTYPAKIEYLLRPAVKDHAFGRVTVINNEGAPLLAGPAAIFVGDAFFGETRIRTTPAGGKLILDLGAETAIKSARRSKTSVRTEGILTKEDVHVVEVTIDIENFLDDVVELEVQDQVPVSLDPRVKVRLVKTVPKDAELDQLTGILTFHARVAPGARTEITLAYEIEAPKDYQFTQMLKE
jgi:hypothetical protein